MSAKLEQRLLDIALVMKAALSTLNIKDKLNEQLDELDILISDVERALSEKKAQTRYVAKGKNQNWYYYTGLDILDDASSIKAVNKITICKGDNELFSFHLDRTLSFVMEQQADGKWLGIGRFKLPQKPNQARMMLRKLAKEIEKDPQYFYSKYTNKVEVVEG